MRVAVRSAWWLLVPPTCLGEGDYFERAQDIVTRRAPGFTRWFKPGKGDTAFYNFETNEYAIISREGRIKTLFKPRKRWQYVSADLKADKAEEIIDDP